MGARGIVKKGAIICGGCTRLPGIRLYSLMYHLRGHCAGPVTEAWDNEASARICSALPTNLGVRQAQSALCEGFLRTRHPSICPQATSFEIESTLHYSRSLVWLGKPTRDDSGHHRVHSNDYASRRRSLYSDDGIQRVGYRCGRREALHQVAVYYRSDVAISRDQPGVEDLMARRATSA